MRVPRGLTLIEVLVALLIFTVLMTVVSQSLIPLFRVTRDSRTQIEANQRAQQILESIRDAWTDPARYRRTCAPVTLPPGVTVRVWALDDTANPTASLPFSTRCTRAIPHPVPAPAKRVTVEVQDRKGKVRARFTLDIREP